GHGHAHQVQAGRLRAGHEVRPLGVVHGDPHAPGVFLLQAAPARRGAASGQSPATPAAPQNLSPRTGLRPRSAVRVSPQQSPGSASNAHWPEIATPRFNTRFSPRRN
ncbi:unnamed protein product, partial [Ixodes persulcatus]